MSLLGIVITLAVIGVLLLLMNQYVPMDPTIKKIIYAVVLIVVVVWLLQTFNLLGSLESVRVR